MKKFAFVLAACTAVVMTSCTGNKANSASDAASATEQTAEDPQVREIKRGMSARLDSLTNCWLNLNQTAVVTNSKSGKVSLSADAKKVKPDYLYNPKTVDPTLETLGLKYRALAVYEIDKTVSDAYEMNDVYTPSMKKLVAELNDPAIELLINTEDYKSAASQVYAMEEEAGRANMFWQTAASSIVEQLFILTKSENQILASLTDKDAEDLTLHISILVDAYADLSEYEPELANLYNVLLPLQALNAISVNELRSQIDSIKGDIENARKALFM